MVASYRYDGLGRRIEKDVGGVITRYVYDGANILLEFDGANALQARYSHGDQSDQPLVQERGGQSYFYHADHRGSIRLITDDTGVVVNEYDYDSYGRFETMIEAMMSQDGVRLPGARRFAARRRIARDGVTLDEALHRRLKEYAG